MIKVLIVRFRPIISVATDVTTLWVKYVYL